MKERRLEEYVAAYLKNLLKMHKSDLGDFLFINDVFYCGAFKNKCAIQEKELKKLHVDHFFGLKRVTKMIAEHESFLIRWIMFIEDYYPVKNI